MQLIDPSIKYSNEDKLQHITQESHQAAAQVLPRKLPQNKAIAYKAFDNLNRQLLDMTHESLCDKEVK